MNGDPDQDHLVPSGKDAEPLIYHGQPVSSRRVDTALEAIAHETGGTIVRLGLASLGNLGLLYKTRIEPAARRHREISGMKDRTERFPLCLLAALGLLLAGSSPPRRGWIWRWTWAWTWPRGWVRSGKNLGLALSIAAGYALFAGASGPPEKPATSAAAQAVARGQAAYAQGHMQEALSAFQLAASLAPRSAIARYDAAATLFQLGRYEEAREHYLQAKRFADRFLGTKIDYGLGNTSLAASSLPEAIASYDDCLASTASGEAMDSVRQDAAMNRQFAIDQSRSLMAPQGQTGSDQNRFSRPDGKKAPSRRGGAGNEQSPDEKAESGPEGGGQGAPSAPEGNTEQTRQTRIQRQLGGAGGAGSPRSGATGGAPEDLLDRALEHIHAARSRRLPDDEPPVSADDDRKDW
jgi:tetratricopeptide (TPR) repeat protein